MIKQIIRTALLRIGGGALNAECEKTLYENTQETYGQRGDVVNVRDSLPGKKWDCIHRLLYSGDNNDKHDLQGSRNAAGWPCSADNLLRERWAEQRKHGSILYCERRKNRRENLYWFDYLFLVSNIIPNNRLNALTLGRGWACA